VVAAQIVVTGDWTGGEPLSGIEANPSVGPLAGGCMSAQHRDWRRAALGCVGAVPARQNACGKAAEDTEDYHSSSVAADQGSLKPRRPIQLAISAAEHRCRRGSPPPREQAAPALFCI
jgi:hypothetical protein